MISSKAAIPQHAQDIPALPGCLSTCCASDHSLLPTVYQELEGPSPRSPHCAALPVHAVFSWMVGRCVQ